MNRTRSLHVLAAACVATLSLPAAAESDTTLVRHPRHHRAAKNTPHIGAADGKEAGNASFYAKHFTGHKTASGERYDPNALTAAHRTLPLGTQVRVVNPKNDKSVVVTVNDRGPVPANRVLDVSSAAADALDMKKSGVTKVETQVVGKTTVGRDEAPKSR